MIGRKLCSSAVKQAKQPFAPQVFRGGGGWFQTQMLHFLSNFFVKCLKKQKMTQVLVPLTPTGETKKEFPALDFSLA